MHVLVSTNEMMLDRSFNISFRYIDDVPTLNHSLFADYIDTCVVFILLNFKLNSPIIIQQCLLHSLSYT